VILVTLTYTYILFPGLPKTMTKKDVEKVFSPFGVLKDVRLVTFRNGHSKGMAYVEYEDEVND